MAEWAAAFKENDVWWAPVNHVHELMTDEMVRESGAFVQVPGPDGPIEMVATPADFSTTRWEPKGIAPDLGQHTVEVLLWLGYYWEQLITPQERGGLRVPHVSGAHRPRSCDGRLLVALCNG